MSYQKMTKQQLIDRITRLEIEHEASAKWIKEQVDFLNTLINTIPLPIFYKNRKGEYTGFNEAFKKALGKEDHEILGKTVFELGPEDIAKKYKEADDALFQNPGVQMYEWKVISADGKPHDVIFYKATFKNAAGEVDGLIGIIMDISELKEVERQREAMQKELFQTSKLASIGELAAGIAHEINNPLAVINANAEIIAELVSRSDLDREKLTQVLERQKVSVKRISSIVKNLSGFSREQTPIIQRLNAHQVIENVLAFLGGIYLKQDIRFVLKLGATRTDIKGDESRLQLVFTSLFSNAKESMPEGGEIQVHTENYGYELIIRVIDHGCGIKKEEIGQIFETFFTTKIPARAIGLGLPISKSILSEMGGRIDVESTPGRGTIVSIRLSVLPEDERL